MKKKINRSLGRRLTVLIILMIVAMGAVMMIVGYSLFKSTSEHYYIEIGETLAAVAGNLIDGDAVDNYIETAVTDEAYDRTLGLLKAVSSGSAEVLYLYAYRAEENNTIFIYDTDESDEAYELGYHDVYDPNYPEYKQQVISGGPVDPIIGHTDYGYIINVNVPFYRTDGSVSGYVGVDFSMDAVLAERAAYLSSLLGIILIITVFFAAVYLYTINLIIVKPINIMATAANSFVIADGENPAQSLIESKISALSINTGDELQSLAESLKSMERKLNEYVRNIKIVTKKSETDALTKLYNRDAFQQQVEAYLQNKADVNQIDAFIMIDVDRFKLVNDLYGHSAGDEVLAQCAASLKTVLRGSDIVARHGGDEFVVFCKSIHSVTIAKNKAHRIRKAWRNIVPSGSGGGAGISASIGISFSPKDGGTFRDLYENADAALYAAKEAGRDGVVVYDSDEAVMLEHYEESKTML